MNILGAVTWVRITWTLGAALGTGVSFALLFMAITDLKLLRRKGINSWRQYVAKTSLLVFIGGFSTQIVYLVAGIVSFTQPVPYNHITLGQIISGGLFLFGAFSSIALAIVIFYRRRFIIEIIEHALSDKESEVTSNGIDDSNEH